MKPQIKRKNIPLLATCCVFVMIYAIGAVMYRGFLSPTVFINLLIDNAFVGIIAVGMTFVIISGGIDLSVGSVVAFTGVFTATLIEIHGVPPFAAILGALLIGAVLGFFMGVIIHVFQLPAFLVTLVGMFLMRGLSFLISLTSIPIKNPLYSAISLYRVPLGGDHSIPVTALFFVLVLAAGVYISHFTRFGRTVYAIGGNEQSAVLMGLPVGRTKILIYTLNSLCCAAGGVVFSFYTLSGYPLATVGLEMDVIAAVVIGGTLLTGGVGYLEGTLVGVLILGLIQTIITFQGTLSSWWTKIIIGLLLCSFILLQTYISSTSSKRVK